MNIEKRENQFHYSVFRVHQFIIPKRIKPRRYEDRGLRYCYEKEKHYFIQFIRRGSMVRGFIQKYWIVKTVFDKLMLTKKRKLIGR
jgi:hypothetical protein